MVAQRKFSGIQGILGVSKSHPHIATLQNRDKPDYIDFMFGTECLTSYHRDDLATRNCLIGMLCTTGMRLADVARAFELDPRQCRRYAKKMESEGLAGLANMKRGVPAKVTPDVEAFVCAEFRELFSRSKRGFRDELRESVHRKFGIWLSYERIRQITKPVREELKGGELAKEVGDEGAEGVASQMGAVQSAASKSRSALRPNSEGIVEGREAEGRQESSSKIVLPEKSLEMITTGASGSKIAGTEPVSNARLRKGFYTRYAGGLLLNVFLSKLLRGTTKGMAKKTGGLFLYLASMVMQMVQFGCVNLQRAKGIICREFGVLIGLDKSPVLRTMRRWSSALARTVDAGNVQAALAKNYLEHIVGEKEVFYVDGHFGAYTGSAPFLLGYYPQAHFWVPGRTHYMLCDRQGLPVFFELRDESDDLRQAIPRLIRRAQKLVGEKEKISLVFDRGGYNRELFASFDDELNAHYITWEKHDATDYSEKEIEWEEFEVELQGNHECKPKKKKFWVAGCPADVRVSAWGKKSEIRHHRKILLKSEVKDRDGEVKGYHIAPFLSNDAKSTNEELARRILDRWLQENGFKRLSGEFGLDEITSYLSVPYNDELKGIDPEAFAEVSEREIDNPRRKKLDDECRKLRKRIETLENRLARLMKEGRSSGHRRVREVEDELQKRRVELDESEQKRASEPVRINQLQYLVEEGYERPDFSRKLLMDLLKVCAHNARRQAEEVLKKYYLNRRDHVTLLRRMINAGGHVKLDKQGVLRVRLERLNTDGEDEVFEKFLKDINRRNPRTFGAQRHLIRFELAAKS